MKSSHAWMAACASALLLAGGAWANDRTGAADVDCAKGTVSSSGTASPQTSAKAHHGVRARQASADAYTVHGAFPQCAEKTDRNAMAECVRTNWESHHGMPGDHADLAASTSQQPC